MKTKIKIFIISVLLFSCSKENNKNKIIDINNTSADENLNIAIIKGDTIEYAKYYKEYSINGHHKEFLYYAILMAEKNNYSQAYFDIATILEVFNYENPNNEFLGNYELYCVLKAYELGNEQAKQAIEKLYIKSKKPVPNSSSILCK